MRIGRKALEEGCRDLASKTLKPALEQLFGQRVGFALLLFDFGSKGNMQTVAWVGWSNGGHTMGTPGNAHTEALLARARREGVAIQHDEAGWLPASAA